MNKVELYAYTYDKESDTYNINTKPVHVFKDMTEFEEISGIYAMTYFMQHPLANLGFCYCYKGEDILDKECLRMASYGFMEE